MPHRVAFSQLGVGRSTNGMRKWIDLMENFTENGKVIILPAGYILHHGTDDNWNPTQDHIIGPAWFGDKAMADNYTAVMGHETPVVLSYRTTKPLKLLDVSEGSLGSEELGEMCDDDTPPKEMAWACKEAGYEGWMENDGEIMICDTSSLELTDA